MSELGTADRPAGLRERKKAKTRAAIREHALRLFREQGYGGTTVEQIAEAAEVSPATFYRYFPTKEDVVLQDDLDVLTFGSFEAQPAELSPLAAVRAAMADGPAQVHRRGTAAVPGDDRAHPGRAGDPGPRAGRVRPHHRHLRRRAGQAGRPGPGRCRGTRHGRRDLRRDHGHRAARCWTGAEVEIDDLFAMIDRGLAQLEAGLPL